MPATLPAPYPMVDPAIYGSGRGIVEVAVWNLDGSPDTPASGLPIWLVVLSAAIPVTLVAGLIFKEKKMAAKRKRGLGGSPEHHAAEMSVARSGAIRYFKSATEAAKRGACPTAFRQLAEAFALDGAADSHGAEARHPTDRSLADKVKASNTAEGAFKANCMKGGANIAGLSGLRRKARKARR